MEDCIFCKIVKGEIPSEKVIENEDFVVIKDVKPAIEGHSLVIPKKHFETFSNMPCELGGGFVKTVQEAVIKLLEDTGSEGYNLVINSKGVAGQIVPHFHMHILPRKKGDGFRVSV